MDRHVKIVFVGDTQVGNQPNKLNLLKEKLH
jgi:hypothetical protein